VTGYQKSKSLISAGRPNKYKILHKIVREQTDAKTERLTDISLLVRVNSL